LHAIDEISFLAGEVVMDVRAGLKDTTTATTTAFAAIAAASSGAVAADMSFGTALPPPPLAPSWDGFYVGANLGASWLNSTQDPSGLAIGSAGSPFGSTGGTSTTATAVGFLGGVQLGYNWQHSNFVYGLETDLSWIGSNTASSTGNLSFGSSRYNTSAASSSQVDALATFRARFGLDFNGTLPYLTAGFALGHMKNAFSLTAYNGSVPGATSTFAATQTSWVPGVVVGGGIEHQLTRNWTLRGEILWVGFESKQFANPIGLPLGYAGAVNNGGVAKFSDSLTIGRVGLNYRF
jgi:outer membrane immunogenic protein